jgi:uncharacterized membrane protein
MAAGSDTEQLTSEQSNGEQSNGEKSNNGQSNSEQPSVFKGILDELPVDRLKGELQHALSAAAGRTAEVAGDKISDLTERLTDVAANGGVAGKVLAEGGKAAATGGSPLMGALKGGVMGVKDKAVEAVTGGSGGSGGSKGQKNPVKATTIIESIDVGVPIDVVYNQWTQFQDFSGFMKKVERVEQKSDEKLDFKAKILWSHRTWEATILEQVPQDKIVWRSKGQKGHVDGSVTFHELAPNLTRVLVVLEYYPQGLFERVGNIWRAQGRRTRVELKHFQRHVMVHLIQDADEVDGWQGEIHGGRVQEGSDQDTGDQDEYDDESADEDQYDEGDEGDEEYEDEGEEDQPEDEYDEADEGDEAEADEDEEPADEYDEGDEDEEYEDEGDEDQPEDEYDEADEGDEAETDEADEDEEPADEYEEGDEGDEEYEDEGDEDLPEDEYDEADEADEAETDEADEDEEPADEDEYEDDEYEEPADEDEEPVDEDDEYEDEDDEELPEDEYEEDDEEDEYDEEPERPRRRAS